MWENAWPRLLGVFGEKHANSGKIIHGSTGLGGNLRRWEQEKVGTWPQELEQTPSALWV